MLVRIVLIIMMLVFNQSCTSSHMTKLKEDRLQNKEQDLQFLEHHVMLPSKPLTLPDIIEIAIANNLDLKVKEREYAIQHERATSEKLKTLPSYTLSAESSWQ